MLSPSSGIPYLVQEDAEVFGGKNMLIIYMKDSNILAN
jgi:hypothetical protein